MRAKAWGLALRVEDWDTSAIELNVELVRDDQKFQSPSKPVEPLNVNKLSSFRRWIPSITGDTQKDIPTLEGLKRLDQLDIILLNGVRVDIQANIVIAYCFVLTILILIC